MSLFFVSIKISESVEKLCDKDCAACGEYAAEKCRGCRACMQLGCPAISFKNKKAVIDATLCVGCGVCNQKCAFGAIGE